jgi:YD repeat-containing protein
MLTLKDARSNLSTFAYDTRGRLQTVRDPIGTFSYDYDDQGNLVEQRKYEHPLVGVSAGTKPTPAEPAIAVLDRTYDAANRLIEELSPEVQLDGSRERIRTRFTYDAAGNQISKTIAFGTAALLSREVGNVLKLATALTQLGDVQGLMGQWPAAERSWREALAILTDLDHPDADGVLRRLGGVRTRSATR